MTDLDTPLTKEPGALKDAHEAELGAAGPPLFDVHAYVEEFGASIVPAYRQGVADAEWPVDVGLARSVIPPGTAAARDFSRLAPRLPELMAERCVGCMACVSACPDTAILGDRRAGDPAGRADRRLRGRAARSRPGGTHGSGSLRPHPQVRRRAGQGRPGAGAVRHLRGADPLQGLRRVCRCLHRAGTRRPVHAGQGRRRARRGVDARPRRPRHALLPIPADHPDRVPQREGPGGPDARRARRRLRGRRRLVRRLRRGDRDPDDGRGDPPGPRPGVDGHRRGDRLQHGLRQHVPVQSLPRPMDELAVRERPGGRPGHPRSVGPGRPRRPASCG